MNRVYWVRHGENRANLTREFSYKKVDYPLTPRGVLQAEQAAAYFAGKPIRAVYSSPLLRARQTAEIIAAPLSLPVEVLEELREINVGDLEGREPSPEAWALHDNIFAEWWRGGRETAFPGGENGYQVLVRIRTAVNQILAGRRGEEIVIVSHGGCLLMSLADIAPGSERQPKLADCFGNCGFAEFIFENNIHPPEGKMLRWGVMEHLHGEAALQGLPRPTQAELDQMLGDSLAEG